ncbi:hypothetical protein [Vibrio alginolyticus]|uniref:hypothetical protein n=1 Tax=Vibrio alginolyticus TaxID=663 RepID=UPI00071FA917|nr:hypothetical protein [Vibrio alginolyticus]ALR95471.1 hypothetical protein AT730_24280 [Vibrio alginolyticus]MBY7710030.1 hypothetical protein [Vibrio alginolyticus]
MIYSLLYPRINRDGHTRDKPIYCVKNDIVTEVKIDEEINCDEVKWEIQFFPLDKAGVDVYEQKISILQMIIGSYLRNGMIYIE